MAQRVGTADFEEKVLKSSIPVVVEFYSDSCIPCKQMAPILGDIEDDYEDKVSVYKVNVNFDSDLASTYQVMASPTILFFKDGQETDRIRGLAKKEALVEIVEKIL
jgi:thioredoxin 1